MQKHSVMRRGTSKYGRNSCPTLIVLHSQGFLVPEEKISCRVGHAGQGVTNVLAVRGEIATIIPEKAYQHANI